MANPDRYTFPNFELMVLDTESSTEVWLDTAELTEFDGIRLACARDRHEAIAEAMTTLETALDILAGLQPKPTAADAQAANAVGKVRA